MFALSLPGFIMSMTSGAVPSDFFVFFDFGAGFGELVVFKPQVPQLEPAGGITMMNPSHLEMRLYNFCQEPENKKGNAVNQMDALWKHTLK